MNRMNSRLTERVGQGTKAALSGPSSERDEGAKASTMAARAKDALDLLHQRELRQGMPDWDLQQVRCILEGIAEEGNSCGVPAGEMPALRVVA